MQPDAPLILAFDTSAAHCAAALCQGDRVLSSVIDPMAKGQAEHLLGLLERMLAAQGLAWSDLDAIAVGIGPGNFTGIRISVAAARGLALALGIPAIGVSTLEALAEGTPRPVLAMLDARRDRVHVQLFAPEPEPPRLMTPQDLATLSVPRGTVCLGYGAPEVAARLGAQAGNAAQVAPPEAFARIARRRLGTPQPAPAPLYLRPADAAPSADRAPAILDDA